jgi:hypothetical protein
VAGKRVRQIFQRRHRFASEDEFLDHLWSHLRRIDDLTSDDIYLLHQGCFEDALPTVACIRFWGRLWNGFPAKAAIGARYAMVLMGAGRRRDGIRTLADALSLEPELWFAFGSDAMVQLAEEVDEKACLALRLAALSALVESQIPADDDEIYERYAEMLELYADDDAALEEIRQVGKRLRERADRGEIARAFVRRGPSRK